MEKQKSKTTLFKFGFKISLNHRGMVINTAEEEFLKNPNAGLFKCKGCKAGVKTRTAQTMHEKWGKEVKENDTKSSVSNFPKKKQLDSVSKYVFLYLKGSWI